MAAKLGFSPRLERVVSDLALLTNLSPMAKPDLGTFAFYVKGRRSSPPVEKMAQQIEGQPRKLRPTSPVNVQKAQQGGPSQSTSLPIVESNQSKKESPNFQVLLVEDNLVNRECLPLPFNPLALTVI